MDNEINKIIDEMKTGLDMQMRKAQERKIIDAIVDIYNGKYENYKEYCKVANVPTKDEFGYFTTVIYFFHEDIFDYIVSKRNNK